MWCPPSKLFPPDYSTMYSRESDALNFYWHTLWQLVNSHAASRRLVCEELLVCGIHLREVVHASQEDIDLDDLRDIRAGLLEDCGEVLDAEFGHLGDA